MKDVAYKCMGVYYIPLRNKCKLNDTDGTFLFFFFFLLFLKSQISMFFSYCDVSLEEFSNDSQNKVRQQIK